jgi:hypothetical protein
VPVVHRHVTAVSDEDRQLVGALAQARAVEPIDPHERRKFRETARPTPEAGWGELWGHFEHLLTLIAVTGARIP